MTERELQKFIMINLKAGFAEQGMNIRVQRSYQPNNHAAPTEPVIVFHRLSTMPAGWVYRHSKITNGQPVIEHSSNRLVAYQFNAIVKEPAHESDTDILASDLINMARLIMQSYPFLLSCRNAGINVLHASPVADVQALNESDNWENQPSVDLVFCTKESLTVGVPKVEAIETHIYGV